MAENEEPTPAPAPQAVACVPQVTEEPKPTWLNPLGVAAVLLIIVFTALIIHHERRHRPAYDLLPLSTADFQSFAYKTGIGKDIAALTIWKKDEELATQGDKLLTAYFGKLAAQTIPNTLNRVGWATVNLQRCLILECGSSWDIKKIFSANTTEKLYLDGFKDASRITLPGGKSMFFALLKPYAVFAPDKETLKAMVECWQGSAPSVGDYLKPLPFTYDPATRHEIFSRYSPNSTVLVGQIIARTAENACTLSETIFKDGKVFATQYFATVPLQSPNAPTAKKCCGFWCWFWWIIGILLIIVIGAPILFIMTVLLFAGYFHIVSKLKHENVPTVAPALPPLSEEMAEDLAGGTKKDDTHAGKEQSDADPS